MSDEKPTPVIVQHNLAEHRFESEVDGYLSVAEYHRQDKVIVLTHTFVPGALRGRGVAEQLVRAALQFAREEELRVVPACSYVGVFIKRHPEFQALMA